MSRPIRRQNQNRQVYNGMSRNKSSLSAQRELWGRKNLLSNRPNSSILAVILFSR